MPVDLANLVHRGDGHDGAHYQMDAAPVDLHALHLTPMEWLAWKNTQSIKYKDPTYAVIEAAAEREKFRWFLGYGWLSSTTDPFAQADNFLSNYGKKRTGKGAMIDAEEIGITVETTVQKATRIEAELKQPCTIYTGLYVAGGTIWRSEEVRNSDYGPRPMALAAYVSRDNLIARLIALGLLDLAIDVWQWTSNGILPDGRHLPGIVGRADIDTILTPAMMDLCCGYGIAQPNPQPEEDDMDHIVCNADAQDGTESPVVGPGAPLANKYLWDKDGLVPLSGADLKALGLTNAPDLGRALSNADLAEIGYYEGPAGGSAAFEGPIALSLSLSGAATGTVG